MFSIALDCRCILFLVCLAVLVMKRELLWFTFYAKAILSGFNIGFFANYTCLQQLFIMVLAGISVVFVF